MTVAFALLLLAEGLVLPPVAGPIRSPGEKFELSVSRSEGFVVAPILSPLSGADVLGPPKIVGSSAVWRLRATGGPCELRVYASAPQDAAFLRVPVLAGERAEVRSVRMRNGFRSGRPPRESREYLEEHFQVGADTGVRLVETTVGPGLQWIRDGRVVGSFAPLLVLQGNSSGAPERIARFLPTYRYVCSRGPRPHVRYLGDILDMWRVELVLYPERGLLAAQLRLLPRFDGHLKGAAFGEWHELGRELRAGEMLHIPLWARVP